MRQTAKIAGKPGQTKRVLCFDTLRFLAAMLIFATHYIADFSPDSFRFFRVFPWSVFLAGLSGKLGVSMLCVLLGYFGYRKAQKRAEFLPILILERYLYFVLMELVFFAMAFLIGYPPVKAAGLSLFGIFRQSFSLGWDFYAVFWSLLPMFIGSAIVYVLGFYKAPWWMCLVATALCIAFRQEWVASCTAGAFLYCLASGVRCDGILRKWPVQLILFFVPLFLFRSHTEESFIVYLEGTVVCMSLVLITIKNEIVQAVFNCRIWKVAARTYAGIFLMHLMLLQTLGGYLMNQKWLFIPFAPRFFLVFLILTAILIALSIPVEHLMDRIMKALRTLLSRAVKPSDA